MIFQVRCFIFQRADWSVGGHFTPVDLSSRTKASREQVGSAARCHGDVPW